jgi:hypothetical protein
MKISTAYNHQRRLMNTMCAIYAGAVYSRPNHRDLCAEVVAKVWEDSALKRCPSWVHHGLMIYRNQLSERIYDHLRWGFKGVDGVIRESYSDLSESDRAAVNRGDLQGRHYWLTIKRQKSKGLDGSMIETIVRQFTSDSY